MTEDYDLVRGVYHVALASAKNGDLSAAVRFASAAMALSGALGTSAAPDIQGSSPSDVRDVGAMARRLMGICLYELGDTAAAANILAGFPDLADEAQRDHELTVDGLREVGSHMRRGKWRAALKAAEAVPHQSVRLLNIRGCILAGAKRYAAAGRLFTQSMGKDRGGHDAPEYLMETTKCAKYFWRRLWILRWI